MKKYYHNELFFKTPDLINSYWAGFIAADGCIRDKLNHITIGLAIKDKSHLIKFASDCEYNGPIAERFIKKDDPKFLKKEYRTANLAICGAKQLIQDLNINYNITSRKSLTLIPPVLSFDNTICFIKGLIDGDGTIRLENQRLEFSIVGTKEILEWICNIFDTLVPSQTEHLSKPRQRIDRGNNNHYCYKLTGFRAYSILSIMDKVNTPKLERKWTNIELAIKPTYKCQY